MSQYVVPFSNSLAASATQTMVQIVGATNRHALVKEISVGFDAVAGAAPPLIELLRQSSAGTSSGTPTPSPWDDVDTAAAQFTAATVFTVEPTAGNILGRWRTWALDILYPLGDENRVKAGNRLGLRITTLTGQTPTCSGHIRVLE